MPHSQATCLELVDRHRPVSPDELGNHNAIPRHARGTIYTAAEQIDKIGGPGASSDGADEERVAEALRETADKFGGIDVLINRPSYSGGRFLRRQRPQRLCCRSPDRHTSRPAPPSSAALGLPMARITSGTTTRGAAH
jgi:hypothetical protein